MRMGRCILAYARPGNLISTRIRQLIIDLAHYERAAHEVRTTTEQLRVALFGPQPAAYALVAESANQVVGFPSIFGASLPGKGSTESTSRTCTSCRNTAARDSAGTC